MHGQAQRLGIAVVPIAGIKRVKWLEDNVAALVVRLTDVDLTDLDPPGARVSRSPATTSTSSRHRQALR